MKMSGNTILITGGTSGIGFELATQLLELGNTVIVTGRDQAKLAEAKRKLPGLHTIQSDVGDPKAIPTLCKKATQEFPKLNVLVNNAGIMKKINLHDRNVDLTALTQEIEINLMGPIRMVSVFLPHLKAQESAAIINVSSGLAFVPLPISPVYCATKAGMHSFTQSLRTQLKNTRIKVIELAPPAVETPLLRTDFTDADLVGIKGMDVRKFGQITLAALKKGIAEIRPGQSNLLKLMSRIAPQFIAAQLGKSADAMLAQGK